MNFAKTAIYEAYKKAWLQPTVVLYRAQYNACAQRKLKKAVSKICPTARIRLVKTKILSLITGADYKGALYMLTAPERLSWESISEIMSSSQYRRFYRTGQYTLNTYLAEAKDTDKRPDANFNYFKKVTEPVLKKGFVTFPTPFIVHQRGMKVSAELASAVADYDFPTRPVGVTYFSVKSDKIIEPGVFVDYYRQTPTAYDFESYRQMWDGTSCLSNRLIEQFDSQTIARLLASDSSKNTRCGFVASVLRAISAGESTDTLPNPAIVKQIRDWKMQKRETTTTVAKEASVTDSIDDLF